MSKTMPKPGEFCWNELMTGDTKKAKSFYSSLLGWKSKDMDMGEDMTYTLFSNAEKDIGGLMAIPKDQAAHIPPHWMSYISVENLDETVKQAKNLGAEIKCPPKDVGDFGRFAIIVDPTGAHIAFWQSLKAC